MMDQETEIANLEQGFPAVSDLVFSEARRQALASGHSVLQSEQGVIYEVFPDGTRKKIKDIEPPTHILPGTKFVIR